jgi:hypothetical protein
MDVVIKAHGIELSIICTLPLPLGKGLYRQRNQDERFFNKLKQFRRYPSIWCPDGVPDSSRFGLR